MIDLEGDRSRRIIFFNLEHDNLWQFIDRSSLYANFEESTLAD